MKRRTRIILSLLTVAGCTGLAGVFLLNRNRPGKIESATARAVRRDMSSSVIATGVVKPKVGAEVKVGSRVSGVVKKLKAQIGDHVAAGQVIAELDDAELKAKLGQAEAALAKAESEREFAALNLERSSLLGEKDYISQQEWDRAANTLKTAEAQVKEARASVAFARVQLAYVRITAPIPGVIASISTQEGETVSASLSAPTFVNIIDLERLEVQAYVDETDIGRIHEGQTASFTVDTYPDTDFQGRVSAIHPKAVILDNVVNYIATVEITDDQDRILRPEMTANVTLFLEARPGALAVPAEAVGRDGGERYVIVLENGRRERRTVKIGRRDGGYVEILDGLDEGQTVVILA